MPDITEVDALIGQAYDCILEPEGWVSCSNCVPDWSAGSRE